MLISWVIKLYSQHQWTSCPRGNITAGLFLGNKSICTCYVHIQPRDRTHSRSLTVVVQGQEYSSHEPSLDWFLRNSSISSTKHTHKKNKKNKENKIFNVWHVWCWSSIILQDHRRIWHRDISNIILNYVWVISDVQFLCKPPEPTKHTEF